MTYIVPLMRTGLFHSTTALESKLRRLAFFMIISKLEVRNSLWSAKNRHLAKPWRASPRLSWVWMRRRSGSLCR